MAEKEQRVRVKGQKLFNARKGRTLWRSIIAYFLELRGISKEKNRFYDKYNLISTLYNTESKMFCQSFFILLLFALFN